jgi:hypothetical protein
MTTVTRPCLHAPMGRHEAADGSAPHPLVEEALRRHPHGSVGAHSGELPGRRGPIGWPGPDPDEGGEPVGWPGGLPDRPGAEQSSTDEPADDEPPAHPEAPASEQRRGWRRLLGRPTAA